MSSQVEHKSPKFAVGMEFANLADLKHACKRAAILDVYEFCPERVDPDRYTLKCKSQGCPWYLHATPRPGNEPSKPSRRVARSRFGPPNRAEHRAARNATH